MVSDDVEYSGQGRLIRLRVNCFSVGCSRRKEGASNLVVWRRIVDIVLSLQRSCTANIHKVKDGFCIEEKKYSLH